MREESKCTPSSLMGFPFTSLLPHEICVSPFLFIIRMMFENFCKLWKYLPLGGNKMYWNICWAEGIFQPQKKPSPLPLFARKKSLPHHFFRREKYLPRHFLRQKMSLPGHLYLFKVSPNTSFISWKIVIWLRTMISSSELGNTYASNTLYIKR